MKLFKKSEEQIAKDALKAKQAKELQDLKDQQAKAKGPRRPGKVETSVKNGTAKVVSFIAGDAHFVLKSSADGVARAEAVLVHKLTGKAKFAVIEDRHNKTEQTQETIKKTSALIKQSIKKTLPGSKFRGNATDVEIAAAD